MNSVFQARGTKSKKANESDEGLALGEPIPDLVVKSEKDEDVNVKNLAEGHAGVVIFLVPKADTRMYCLPRLSLQRRPQLPTVFGCDKQLRLSLTPTPSSWLHDASLWIQRRLS